MLDFMLNRSHSLEDCNFTYHDMVHPEETKSLLGIIIVWILNLWICVP